VVVTAPMAARTAPGDRVPVPARASAANCVT
jgi:hypothetical protein